VNWIRAAPAFVSTIFDGHLCLAEFCLCGAGGHEDIAKATRELLAIAQSAESIPGQALAMLILGEAALFSGDLESAERWLTDAERLHVQVDSQAGRVLALQRLAEIALARGQNYRASRMVQKGLRLAEATWLAPHLVIRLRAIAVEAAANAGRAADATEKAIDYSPSAARASLAR
jgi:ATP/maltotriose-dependent transcriptional regulator MalT